MFKGLNLEGIRKEKSVVLTENFLNKAREAAEIMIAGNLDEAAIPGSEDFLVTARPDNDNYDYFENFEINGKKVYICWPKEGNK